MTAQPTNGAALELAVRLKELRETRFAGVKITQRALGKVLRSSKPLSAPLISSWEKGTAVPAKRWIAAYATFFGSSRSVEGGQFRLLREDDLTEGELSERAVLERELLSLRTVALNSGPAGPGPDFTSALRGPWHFSDGQPVTIVCAEVPTDQLAGATPTHPTLAYGELYKFASIDALFELHGHIRAANPNSDVFVRKVSELERDDYTTHLVVVGGVDWNALARRLPRLLPKVPIVQVSPGDDPRQAYFEVDDGTRKVRHKADVTDKGILLSDVGQFLRVPNPFNVERTLSVCCGLYSVGTYGAVRALTDKEFRDRNAQYVSNRFAGSDSYSMLMTVLVLDGDEAVTPDWTLADTRLHEWPDAT